MSAFTHYIYAPVAPDLAGLDCPRPYRMLRPTEVCERTTLSRSHVDRLVRAGRFPAFERLSARTCGLPEHVLDAFLAERITERRGGLPPLGERPPLPAWRFDIAKVPARVAIRLLRRQDVVERTGLAQSPLHRLVAQQLFPCPVSLGERAARWVAHEVDAWVRSHAPRGAVVVGARDTRVEVSP